MNFDPREIETVKDIVFDVSNENIIGRRVRFVSDTGGKDLFYAINSTKTISVVADVAEELSDEDLKTAARDEFLKRLRQLQ